MSEVFSANNKNTSDNCSLSKELWGVLSPGVERVVWVMGATLLFFVGTIHGKDLKEPNDIGLFGKYATDDTIVSICNGARFRSNPMVGSSGMDVLFTFDADKANTKSCIDLRFTKGSIHTIEGFCPTEGIDATKPCDMNGKWIGMPAVEVGRQIPGAVEANRSAFEYTKNNAYDLVFVNQAKAEVRKQKGGR